MPITMKKNHYNINEIFQLRILNNWLSHLLLIACIVIIVLSSSNIHAQSAYDYQNTPPLSGGNNTPPMVMLSMSSDHQLFFKAYNDFDDINGDGNADTTYNKTIEYIGYFDSEMCYVYGSGVFSPSTPTSASYYCNTRGKNQWSGNFLNWVSMTRIDIVRKILYGGLRSTDTDKTTILERSHLTSDAHSFAKYYNGNDLKFLTPFNVQVGKDSVDSGVTFCNTTVDLSMGIASHKSTQPPLIRAVKGNFSFWPAGERWQCLYQEEQYITGGSVANSDPGVLVSLGIYAHHQSPKKSTHQLADYIARVNVCTSKSNALREECLQYPKGNSKPTGLLQRYGQAGEIQFGLITGSYMRNKDGGVLRKNIGPLSDEINTTTDGTFKTTLANGGIIQGLNSLRLANWYAQKTGLTAGTYQADKCTWGLNIFDNGSCTNWGNPFGEILLETYRYLAGATPTRQFTADDSFISPYLKPVMWEKPLTTDNYCSNLNILAFNSSTISYDGNHLNASDINLSTTGLNAITDRLGTLEGIKGEQYFVGKTLGVDQDELCTEKVVGSLSSVRGTCPDAPRLNGSYYSSGLAFYAKTNDINKSIDGDQTVNTFGFSLAPSIPKIVLPRPKQEHKKITIFPACRNKDVKGNCAIVDFKIIEPHNDDDGDGIYTGLMYVTWEDSEQGGDFDQDINGLIAYELDEQRLTVKTRVLKNSTFYKIGFGFVVNGVSRAISLNGNAIDQQGNGFHVVSGTNGFDGDGCRNCSQKDGWSYKKFIVASGRAQFLEQPLYYAAKYGGFKDVNGNNIPDLQNEWDAINNLTGAPTPDGIPDNYHNANNPKELKIQFDKVITEILAGASSGTGSSVVTNAGDGVGLFLQSLYYPTLNYAGSELSWVGTLNGMFMDEHNHVREDTDGSRGLTIADKIIDIEYDPTSKNMMAQRYNINTDGTRGAKQGGLVSLHTLKPVWSAHQALAEVTDPITQRIYNTSAQKQRHILTAIDDNNDGLITQNAHLKDFIPATFTGPNNYLLGNVTSTEKVINYIRGQDYPEFRSRAANINTTTSGLETWRLGDIANATPLIINAPKVGYDIEFSDSSYLTYREKYKNRRTVIYASANDGMIHAFNGGFYNANDKKYSTDKHPLGAELWGYVPYNLLPHLQWLTDHDYPHVAYMDGKLQSFDVNIFNDDADHPGGWGTILVAGMRFGGGPIEINNAGTPQTMRSAWVVLDITNPEKPPKLVAEITDPNLGFTTTNVDIIKARSPNTRTGNYTAGTKNNWFLTFGSGPYGKDASSMRRAQKTAVSDQSAKLFLFDLRKKQLKKYDTGVMNTFVGGVHATDWNRDYQDDVIYYGLVGGSIDKPEGQLRRAQLTFGAAGVTIKDTQMLDVVNQAFSGAPFTRIDKDYNYWVFAGTGRFFNDIDGTYTSNNGFYGLKEPINALNELTGNTIKKRELIDTTNIQTYSNGQVKNLNGSQVFLNTGDPAATTDDVTKVIADNKGWYLDFPNNYARNIGQATLYSTSLLFTAFTPNDDLCSGEVGNTRLYQREFFNGLSPTYSAVTEPGKTISDGTEVGEAIPDAIDLGDNFYAEPNEEGLTQSNEGELKRIDLGQPDIKNRRESWREVNKDW
ncbi:pilus assembly protein [Marinagarivorans algicola]|uniref:pilus assembly protein n=1 Tax=Marinagarivorans algicola TaxID=1513270 RepID=UPI0006B57982|nr:PilC/PilY family type IV pilus protein [Marinagarivorans algicola]